MSKHRNPSNGSADRNAAPNFDLLARPYRWMEYASFGHALERCRFHYLGQFADRSSALVLGDGDGRFTARLLAHCAAIRVHAVDGSPAMLAALTRRAQRVGAADRLTTEVTDLRTGIRFDSPSQTGTAAVEKIARNAPDIIATHFFLDCLATEEVEQLARHLHAQTRGDTLWVISEFAIPDHGWMRPLAAVLVAVLYRAFRLLTHLGPQQLPRYASALQAAGWRRIERYQHLRGLLVSELWKQSSCVVPAIDGLGRE